jgi:hypothetical protein
MHCVTPASLSNWNAPSLRSWRLRKQCGSVRQCPDRHCYSRIMGPRSSWWAAVYNTREVIDSPLEKRGSS